MPVLGSCSTDFGTGLPCLLPYSLGGETRFSCTTVGPAAEEGEGVVPRCPTRLLQVEGLDSYNCRLSCKAILYPAGGAPGDGDPWGNQLNSIPFVSA